jgi:hypothetical protein
MCCVVVFRLAVDGVAYVRITKPLATEQIVGKREVEVRRKAAPPSSC